MMPNLLRKEEYDPRPALDAVIQDLGLKSDSGLARYLGVGAPLICRVRQKRAILNTNLLVRMHDATGRSLDELRALAHIPKTKLTIPKG